MSDHRPPISNDTRTLVPKTKSDNPVFTFDFPALHVGIAEYTEGPTGCTVFYFPDGVSTAVDLRGGAVGAMETNYIQYQIGSEQARNGVSLHIRYHIIRPWDGRQ